LYLFLFIAGGITIFGSFALLIGKLCFDDINSRGVLYISNSISTFGVFFVPALMFSYCTTKNWFSYSNADKFTHSKLIVYVVILSVFILPVIAALGHFNEQITLPESMQNIETWMQKMEEQGKVFTKILTANSTVSILLLNLVIMALLPAIFEEFLFRGALQPFFTKWFANKHSAVILTAFIFSAIHFQFYGFIPRFLLGIYLGYLLIWGKSLWLPIIAHFMHNAISIILDFAAQKRGIDMEALAPTQVRGFYPLVLLCTILVIVGIYRLWKKRIMING
jgi:membrane protease YdiL (CAAX protease family)